MIKDDVMQVIHLMDFSVSIVKIENMYSELMMCRFYLIVINCYKMIPKRSCLCKFRP
jgi:hypothetical protein